MFSTDKHARDLMSMLLDVISSWNVERPLQCGVLLKTVMFQNTEYASH